MLYMIILLTNILSLDHRHLLLFLRSLFQKYPESYRSEYSHGAEPCLEIQCPYFELYSTSALFAGLEPRYVPPNLSIFPYSYTLCC